MSTTVDAELLQSVRSRGAGLPDGRLVDQAFQALLAQDQAAQIDASYAVYEQLPLDCPDEWGDLASFRAAAGAAS